MNRLPKTTPATIGATLASAGSGLIALINIHNLNVVLVFAVISFLSFLLIVWLVAETAGDENNRGQQ